jgi:hypothetical protein
MTLANSSHFRWHCLCLFALYEPSGRRYREEARMLVVEERLSLLEGKMEQVGATLVRMEGLLLSLNQKVDNLDERVDRPSRDCRETDLSVTTTVS